MTTNTRMLLAAVSISTLFAASCGGNAENSTTSKDTVVAAPRQPVEIVPVGNSPEFPDAQLSLGPVSATKVGTDSAKVSFSFVVKNYELKMQTADSATKGCNNSAQGQHIHFIMDNNPYKALYEPKNEITLANNTEHYLMAFLSRSYHESLKSKGAALVYHFKIDEKGNLKKLDDPKTPMVFYSRPKGDYIGKDTTNLLLDFYVWNAALGTDDYKVKADVASDNGQGMTMTISDWKSNFIKNLGTGKAHVTLTLLGKDGKAVEGPMTSATRNFNMSAGEPMK